MYCRDPVRYRRHAGFSLVELMVGLTVGFIAILAITQTLGVYDAQKRSTTAGADAQENGLMAMALLQEDARKAAAGFTHPAVLNCRNYYSYFDNGSGSGGPIAAFNTLPVVITDAASGSSDAVTVRTAFRFVGSIPTYLKSTMTSPGSDLEVRRSFGFDVDDSGSPTVFPLAIIVHPSNSNCTLIKVTAVDHGAHVLKHENNIEVPDTPEYNPTDSYKTGNGWPTYPAESMVFNVGNTLVGAVNSRTYEISNNTLQITSALSSVVPTTEDAVTGVVNLQAQYGIADVNAQSVSSWVNATGTEWSSNVLDRDHANRVKAVRIVVVARAGKLEASNVTEACTNAAGVANTGPCSFDDAQAPVIDLTGDANWRRYRYRVYQTVIPLRNMVWAKL